MTPRTASRATPLNGWAVLLLVALFLPVLSVVPPASGAPHENTTANLQDRRGAVVQRRPSLRKRIERLPSVRWVKVRKKYGTRIFQIGFAQPADHRRPRGPKFVQRLTLVPAGTSRPVVLNSTGYELYGWESAVSDDVTDLVRGNQLTVEHRFFGSSRPAHPRWRQQLTIRQAADDHHRVVRQFRTIFRGKWLSTGRSKGGMTAVYHRRFHPGDVQGTVAHVAPMDRVDRRDVAYGKFLSTVGTASCRKRVIGLQRRALGVDRDWFLQWAERYAARQKTGWTLAGGVDRALELGVVDAYFSFWQAGGRCKSVPDPAQATRQEVRRFFTRYSGVDWYSDLALEPYVPYYFQAGLELGSPRPWTARLGGLVRHRLDLGASLVPTSIRPTHRARAMRRVDKWVRSRGERITFLYGSLDPWSAEKFRCGRDARARECRVQVARGVGHGASWADLPEARARAFARRVRRWAGLSTSDQDMREAVERLARSGPQPAGRRPGRLG